MPQQLHFHQWVTWSEITKNVLFFELLCENLTDFNTFWYVKSWENLTWTPYRFVRFVHFTLGNPKSHFTTLLFIYLRLFTLAQKKTSSNCSAASAAYLLLFSASYYLHSPSTASGAHYRRSTCIDMDVLRLAVEACCDVCWISAQRTWLNNVEKVWKHVLMQNVVTLNTCCDIACLTFQLPHITSGSF